MIHRTKRFGLAFAAAATLAVGAHPVSADTIAHWDFETDLIAGTAVSGQNVSHPSINGAFDAAIPDISGNGNHLSAFSQDGSGFAVMQFSDNILPSNSTGSTLSITGAPNDCCEVLSSDGDLEFGGSKVEALSTWTIEATVNFFDTGGWQTIVGKDGWQQATNGDANQAPLYFQKKGDGTNQFRINYVDAVGNVHITDSVTAASPNTWYNLAATNDGSTLKFFVNGIEESSLDISGSADTRMVALDESGFAGDDTTSDSPYAWTVARGMYNDGHGDRVNGYIDDVRISNVALMADQFLNGAIDSLTLVVNPTDGSVSLRNDTTEPIALDYYRIESAGGQLSTTGWNSLSDQGRDATGAGPGESWDEVTAANSANRLVEQYLSGESVVAPGEYVAIGAPYTGSGEGDLTFTFAKSGAGLTNSSVVYSSIALPGDFNGDNKVDAADYTLWRDTAGTATLTADHSGDGVVNVIDYHIWAANYGASMAAAAGAVPEPAGLLSVAVFGCLVAARRRRLG